MSVARVLIVTDEMELAGTQRQIVYLARRLDRRHYLPEVVYFRSRSHLVDELERADVPVWYVPKRHRIDPLFVLRLTRLLRQRRPSLVHCFAFSGELWGSIATTLAGRGHLITSVRATYEWYSPIQWWIKRWTAARSVRVVANSHAGAAYARHHTGLEARRFAVVYNGVSFSDPSSTAAPARLRQSLGLPESTVLALFVGRVVPQKDLPTLIDAMAQLRDVAPSAALAIAGEGHLREQIESQVRALRLDDRVFLLGLRPDIRTLMREADFIVLPSLREGLSNVLLEAMAEERAVVASRIGGNTEIVEEEVTGLFFPLGDAAALAESMRRLAADPALRARLGAAGRRRVERVFSLDSMVASMEEVYAACLEEIDHR